MHYANGDYFEGEWFKDKRGGKRGKLTMSSGSKIIGQFIKDKADGTVEFEDKEGNVFQTEADVTAADNVKKSNRANRPLSARKNINQQIKDDPEKDTQPGSFQNGRLIW